MACFFIFWFNFFEFLEYIEAPHVSSGELCWKLLEDTTISQKHKIIVQSLQEEDNPPKVKRAQQIFPVFSTLSKYTEKLHCN